MSQPTDTLRVQQPEASLHPELLPPLAELILTAAKDTQIVVVTHATDLAVQLGRQAADHRLDVNATELVKDEHGQTVVAGREGPLDQPPWHWPKR